MTTETEILSIVQVNRRLADLPWENAGEWRSVDDLGGKSWNMRRADIRAERFFTLLEDGLLRRHWGYDISGLGCPEGVIRVFQWWPGGPHPAWSPWLGSYAPPAGFPIGEHLWVPRPPIEEWDVANLHTSMAATSADCFCLRCGDGLRGDPADSAAIMPGAYQDKAKSILNTYCVSLVEAVIDCVAWSVPGLADREDPKATMGVILSLTMAQIAGAVPPDVRRWWDMLGFTTAISLWDAHDAGQELRQELRQDLDPTVYWEMGVTVEAPETELPVEEHPYG